MAHTWRMVIDATLDVVAPNTVAEAAQAAADYFQSIANGSAGDSLFDPGASTSLAPSDDPGWANYTDGVWSA